MGGETADVRRSIALLAGDAGDAGLAAGASLMVGDSDPGVSAAAERALLLLAMASVRGGAGEGLERALDGALEAGRGSEFGRGVGVGLVGDREDVLRAVAEGAAGFADHRRRGVVLAAALLLDGRTGRGRDRGGVALRAWLDDGGHPSHDGVRAALRWSKVPLMRLRALEWIGRDGLAGASADRLSKSQGAFEHELVLAASHLGLRPARRGRLARIAIATKRVPGEAGGRPRTVLVRDAALPPAGVLAGLSLEARRGLPRFAGMLKPDLGAVRMGLEPLVGDADAITRHAAARAMPPGGVADFCFDRDARVAGTAALLSGLDGVGARTPRGAGREAERERVVRALGRSEHASVRGWADAAAALLPGAATAAGRLDARRAMGVDRPGFVAALRGRMTGAAGPGRLATVMLTRAFGLGQELEGELVELLARADAGDEDAARIAATAVAALGDVTTPAASAAVRGSLRHADGRVRANAVEAAARQGRRTGSEAGAIVAMPAALIELKRDAHHRVRANAVRAALAGGIEGRGSDGGRGAADLASMLGDARPMHRLAGAWLAGRVMPGSGRERLGERWPELHARVAEAARFDADGRVRARAAACSARLDAEMRGAWRVPGGAGASAAPTFGPEDGPPRLRLTGTDL